MVAVLADDTQLVKAGQVLVRLDPIDAETALSRSASALAQTVRQVRQQKATAEQYDSAIETRRLELARAEADLAKREPLLAEQAIAGGRGAPRAGKRANWRARRWRRRSANRSRAHALVDGTAVESNPAVLQARDAYRDAWIAAQRNAVVAPVDGLCRRAQRAIGSAHPGGTGAHDA